MSSVINETTAALLDDIAAEQENLAEIIAAFDLLMEHFDSEGIVAVDKIDETAAMLFAGRFPAYYKVMCMILRELQSVSDGMTAASVFLKGALSHPQEVSA